MALAASMNKFKSEMQETAARNLSHARPAASSGAPARTSTPQPGGNKRPHDAISTPPVVPTGKATTAGAEILGYMVYATQYLHEKFPEAVTLTDIVNYLSLPTELQKHHPVIRRALIDQERVSFTSAKESPTGKELFRYNPIHPVTNAEELKIYLSRLPNAKGILVKELKDGWPDCVASLSKLEAEHAILLTRNKKDNTPKTVHADNPAFWISPAVDKDFFEFWNKCKLPGSEVELRNELEKANLVPTSQVKEVKKGNMGRKEKRKVRRGGMKTTNVHMAGILRDYTKK